MNESEGSNKRPRFSIEPDCELVVEGETFRIHSFSLIQASQVFRHMLASEMLEAASGRIDLPNKSKAEFAMILPWLSAVIPGRDEAPKINKEQVPTLLRWADEYAIDGLKSACERFLISQDTSNEDLLLLAAEFHLDTLFEKCFTEIVKELPCHLNVLRKLLDLGNTQVMERLWPKIFEAAKLPSPEIPLLANPSPAQLWPLFEAALDGDSLQSFRTSSEVKRGMYVRVVSDVVELKRICYEEVVPGQRATWTDAKGAVANRLCRVERHCDFAARAGWIQISPVDKQIDTFYVPFQALKRIPCQPFS